MIAIRAITTSTPTASARSNSSVRRSCGGARRERRQARRRARPEGAPVDAGAWYIRWAVVDRRGS